MRTSPSTATRRRVWRGRVASILLCSSLALGVAAGALPAQADDWANPGESPTATVEPSLPPGGEPGGGPSSLAQDAPPSDLQVQGQAAPTLNVGSDEKKNVGENAYAWGQVSGFTGPVTVSTQVLVGGRWSTSQTLKDIKDEFVISLTYGAGTPGVYTWRIVAEANGQTVVSPEFTLTRIGKAVVTAANAGTKNVGETTYAWGSVAGFTGPVTVSTQALVNGTWSTSQRKTGVTGSYTLPLTYGINSVGETRWRVVAQGGGVTAISPEFRLTRVARPAVTANSTGSKQVGIDSNVWGSVSGFGTPATVSTQVKVNGTWSTSQQKTGVTGSYALPLTYGQSSAGTQTYRVVAQGGGVTAISKEFTFTRTPKPVAGLDSRCLTGRAMCISKKDQTLSWVINGEVRMSMDVRFGSKATPTRDGSFSVFRKSRDHVSSLYNSAMPWAMFFSGGQAVHYSSDFAARGYTGASHGCVNVRDKDKIAALYDQVRIGDKVIVYVD